MLSPVCTYAQTRNSHFCMRIYKIGILIKTHTRLLVPMVTSTWSLIRGKCEYAISTKSLCTGPYNDTGKTQNQWTVEFCVTDLTISHNVIPQSHWCINVSMRLMDKRYNCPYVVRLRDKRYNGPYVVSLRDKRYNCPYVVLVIIIIVTSTIDESLSLNHKIKVTELHTYILG